MTYDELMELDARIESIHDLTESAIALVKIMGFSIFYDDVIKDCEGRDYMSMCKTISDILSRADDIATGINTENLKRAVKMSKESRAAKCAAK